MLLVARVPAQLMVMLEILLWGLKSARLMKLGSGPLRNLMVKLLLPPLEQCLENVAVVFAARFNDEILSFKTEPSFPVK